MESKDYYATLGVAEDAPVEDIKRAYRKLARRYHPDVSDEDDAEARFKEVSEAWEVLGDTEKRAAYDNVRKFGHPGGDPGPGFSDGFGDGFGGGSGGDRAGADFSDFFRSMFGGGGGFADSGQDLHVRLPITLEESFAGCEQTLPLSIPEVDAQGRLTRKQRNLRVKIPAGVTDGQQIRLKGQGGGGPGNRKGDLFVEIQLVPHPRYAVDGRDLTMRVPLAPWEAALGAQIQVETLGGKVNVKVPAGTSSGNRLRLRGRGLPGNPTGDQYLEFEVVVPKQLSARERELFESLAKASDFDAREAKR
ncbi:MAG: DnaJ domain-containing protein [Gammaproteobacteria bacterium]|nr:DnaJ domain-containing protein [Gammaproteobacteria bacterium]